MRPTTDPLGRALDRASHLLPDQGPIGVFIHHNTLHAFQDRTFHEAVVSGAAVAGARPYLEEATFRSHWRRGRIEDQDVDAALTGSDEPLALGHTERTLRRALMRDDLGVTDAEGLRYRLATGSLAAAADRALWDACASRIAERPAEPVAPGKSPSRHRDVLAAHGPDLDVPLHAELQRLAAWFLDQGQSLVPMPDRERGFLAAVVGLYAAGGGAPRFAPGVQEDFRRLAGAAPEDVVRERLASLGVDPGDEPFVIATLLALPGWAGMFSRLERHPEDLHHGPPVRLCDFLAVRLVYEARAIRLACAAAGLPVSWRELAVARPGRPRDPICDVHLLCGLARAGGASAASVAGLGDASLERLFEAVAAFPEMARRQAFQEAYERRYRRQILDAVAVRWSRPIPAPSERRTAQFVFCIDEREESIRRSLEEQSPHFETFGVAGFFGVAIDYQGLDDHRPAAYCPVVVTPSHEIHEAPIDSDVGMHDARTRWRDAWNSFQRQVAALSRTASGGAALSLLAGPIAGVVTAAWVMDPRRTVALRDAMGDQIFAMPRTKLLSVRASEGHRSARGKLLGFTLQEAVDRVAGTLKNIGLTRDFAPIVVFLGHGSTSLNNPHESAHDCGACGGRRGGVNARLFAEMANRPEVRAGVAKQGVVIPRDTWFVGALHDTSDDSVKYSDVGHLPDSHAAHFETAWKALEIARRDNAQERSRRFDDAPLTIGPEAALGHVQARAAHFAQPRPEYGHCTNAICIVGRRAWNRGLHLDRRAFLVSYDPHQDEEERILERILAAVGPVGAGINLEYYFSSVDNEVFGCGTKLPHNITGLIGVMNGHQSDLRTGLPLQMVEIHEPMRLLLLVDATPEALLTVAGRQAEVRQLVVNGWVQLVSVHPDTGAMSVFEGGAFVPYEPAPVVLPSVRRSAEYHQRSRDHLPPALVEPHV